jgi:hypothetical protein
MARLHAEEEDLNHTQEGISQGDRPGGQGKGEQRDGKWRRDKEAWGVK